MRSASTAFQNAVKNNKNFLEKIEVTFLDGTEITITESDIWQNGLKIEDAVSQEDMFHVGSAIINKASITLNNIYHGFDEYDFVGATLIIYVGLTINGQAEYVRMGTYTVLDEPDYNGSFITLECFDNMWKFDRSIDFNIYGKTTLTPYSAVYNACLICGVELGETSDIAQVKSYSIPKTIKTYREVISYYAQMYGCYARCNAYGELDVKWYKTELLHYDALESFPPYPFTDTTKTIGGITFTDNGDGTITANGTSTQIVQFDFYSGKSVMLRPGSYYFKGCPQSGVQSNYYINLYFGDGSGSGSYDIVTNSGANESERGQLFSVSASKCYLTQISLIIKSGRTVNNLTFEAKLTSESRGKNFYGDVHYISSLYNYRFSRKNIKITGIRFFGKYQDTLGQEVEYDYSSGTDGYVLSFNNNPLVTKANGQDRADFVGDKLIDVAFRRATITHSSDPTIEAGDVGIVIDKDGNRYPIVVSSTTFSVGSDQKTSSSAEEAASINAQSLSYNGQAYSTLSDYLAQKVSKAGDTMTGNLFVETDINPSYNLKSDEVSGRMDATALSANQAIGSIYTRDSNDEPVFYSQTYRTTGNQTYTSFIHRRYSADGSTNIGHGFYLRIYNDGSRAVTFPDDASRRAWVFGLFKNSNLTDNTAIATSAWGNALLQFRDTADTEIGTIGAYFWSNGQQGTIIRSRRVVNSTTINNELHLKIADDGTRYVSVSDAASWRTALGINDTVTVKSASNVSVSSQTAWANGTTLTNSGSLAAGTYVLRAFVLFPSNATGRRYGMITSSNTGTASYNNMIDVRNAVNGYTTYCNIFGIFTLTAATTLYLRALQNSGSALSCTGRLEVLRIH